jgi:ribosomal protein S27AE
MSKPLTRQTTDHSDEKGFGFSFFCGSCGKEWKAPSVPFEIGGLTIEHEEARLLLWANEHRIAYEQANLEALMHFNLCPDCGKRVCDDCFGFDEIRKEGVCRKCGDANVIARH